MNDQSAKSKRDDMRARIFAKKPKTKLVAFNGTKIEVHTPPVREVLKVQDMEDTSERVAHLLIRYCYVPGTTQQVFEEGDKETLLNMPFDGELMALQEAINELSDIDVKAAEGNLPKTT